MNPGRLANAQQRHFHLIGADLLHQLLDVRQHHFRPPGAVQRDKDGTAAGFMGYSFIVYSGAHQADRNFLGAYHFVGNAAHRPAIDAGAPVGSHYNQVCFTLAAEAQDFVRRVAGSQPAAYLNGSVAQPLPDGSAACSM
jgi:hypothetical protein